MSSGLFTTSSAAGWGSTSASGRWGGLRPEWEETIAIRAGYPDLDRVGRLTHSKCKGRNKKNRHCKGSRQSIAGIQQSEQTKRKDPESTENRCLDSLIVVKSLSNDKATRQTISSHSESSNRTSTMHTSFRKQRPITISTIDHFRLGINIFEVQKIIKGSCRPSSYSHSPKENLDQARRGAKENRKPNERSKEKAKGSKRLTNIASSSRNERLHLNNRQNDQIIWIINQ